MELIIGNIYQYVGKNDELRGQWEYQGKYRDIGPHLFRRRGSTRSPALFGGKFVRNLVAVTVTTSSNQNITGNPGGTIVAINYQTRPEPKVGDVLRLTRPCYPYTPDSKFRVMADVGYEYKLELLDVVYAPSSSVYVSKVDIWNWFDIWNDPDVETPPTTGKQECQHEYANVSFMGIRMACKHCGVDQPVARRRVDPASLKPGEKIKYHDEVWQVKSHLQDPYAPGRYLLEVTNIHQRTGYIPYVDVEEEAEYV